MTLAENPVITKIFADAAERFTAWLRSKPTGEFNLTIPVNQGGVRRPEIGIKEKG
jgi:hypothetical protein